MSPDYSNPYDFGKPIRDLRLFAGRQKELQEIDYYLELSKSDRPIYHNLALIGPRSVGKTSLLNMIEHIAKRKGLLAVKSSLNEDISTNEVQFFKEVLDNLITKGAEKGMYGGISGSTYKLFRKAMDLLDIKAEIPFLFGTAYIGFKKGEKTTLSQQVLINDLSKAYQEAKKNDISTIVLLFDECDLLSQNKALLQKLRNVFSDLDGYILVFCGTEKMFPDMSEVFSPIPRLFKRIDVGNFRSVEETKDCILKPLTEEERDLVNQSSIVEIHQISNGNPYEVQLLCHFMYRQFKEDNASNIALNVEVLDRVLDELDRLRTREHHEVANKIKRLIHSDNLRMILATLEFPDATIEQLSRFLVLSKLDSVNLKDISSRVGDYKFIIPSFVGSIIKKDDQGRLSFAGDSFDVLYLKHFAISRGIKAFHFGVRYEPEMNMQSKLTDVLFKDLDEYEINVRFDKIAPVGKQDGFKGQKFIFGGKFKTKPSKPGEWSTVFTFSPAEVDKRFYQGSPDSHRFRINMNFLGSGFVIQAAVKKPEDLEYVKKRIDELETKLLILGFKVISKDEVDYNLEGIKNLNKKDYATALSAFDNALALNNNFELAWANKGMTYFEMKEYEKALICLEKWRDIRPRLAEAWERIGATLINLDRPKDAKKALQKAVELKPEMWVAWDNLGRALHFSKEYDGSIEAMDRSLKLKSDNQGALLFKGLSLHNLGRLNDAIKMYDKVLSLDQENLDALANKAKVLMKRARKGDKDLALELFSRCLMLNPNNIPVLTEQSLIFQKKGMMDKAIANCDKIIELEPNIAVAYYNRSCFNCNIEEFEKALSDLEKAVELDSRFKESAKKDEDFEKIRDMPRFKELIT